MTDPLAEQSRLLARTPEGLYCEGGGFHIDPWGKVESALITHAHADHARPGSSSYLCADPGRKILKDRVGGGRIEGLPYGQTLKVGDVLVSFHPSGHILGSAQIRIEGKGEVCVVTGDYNSTHRSGACAPFECVPCDVLVTESTFGLPIYRWPDPEHVFEDIRAWWKGNAEKGRTSVIPAYPLGKSQRLLAGMGEGAGPIAVYGNMKRYISAHREEGVAFPEFIELTEDRLADIRGRGLVFISSAGQEPALLKKLGELSFGFASGWMRVRGRRRHNDYDRGFVLSDHSDWDGLLKTVKESGAERVGVTHGQLEPFARYLREMGRTSFIVPTHFEESGD